jgi:predicted RNA-binding protein with TRAM domain
MERSFRSGDRGGFGYQGGGSAPVNVGDELEVKIEGVGEKGDGIAKKDGFVMFVPNTKQGDNVRIRVTKVLKKLGFAEVIGQSGSSGEQQEESQESTEESYDDTGEQSESSEEEEGSSEDSEDFGEEEEQK